LDNRGSIPSTDDKGILFLFRHRVQAGSGPTQPPIQWVRGALTLGLMRLEHQTDHSPLSSEE